MTTNITGEDQDHMYALKSRQHNSTVMNNEISLLRDLSTIIPTLLEFWNNFMHDFLKCRVRSTRNVKVIVISNIGVSALSEEFH